MIRTLAPAFALLALVSLATPAAAADDGGFGTKRFSNQSPSALGGEGTFDPAAIEPAAGDDAAPADTTGDATEEALDPADSDTGTAADTEPSAAPEPETVPAPASTDAPTTPEDAGADDATPTPDEE